MSRHTDQPGAFGQIPHGLDFADGYAYRLLHQHVLTSLQRHGGEFEMGLQIGENGHRINSRVRQQ